MNFNHIIQIIFIIIIIYLLINNYEKISELTNTDITENDIIKEYNLDIPATRNMAQIINQALEKTSDNEYRLYLPINMVKFNQTIYIDECNIKGALSTKEKAGLKFTNKSIQNVDFDIFPQYTIIAWSISNIIPKNWKICNGKSYIKKDGELLDFIQDKNSEFDRLTTPDLTNRFIMHEYNDYKQDNNNTINERIAKSHTQNYTFDTTGGLEKVVLENKNIPLHYHYLPLTTSEEYTHSRFNLNNILNILPSIDSYYKKNAAIKVDNQYSTVDGVNGIRVLDSGISCGPTISRPDDPTDDHWLEDNGQYALNNNTTPHNNMPPFCKLMYIIKL